MKKTKKRIDTDDQKHETNPIKPKHKVVEGKKQETQTKVVT